MDFQESTVVDICRASNSSFENSELPVGSKAFPALNEEDVRCSTVHFLFDTNTYYATVMQLSDLRFTFHATDLHFCVTLHN